MGLEPPSLRLRSANAGKSDRSNPVTFSLPSGRTNRFVLIRVSEVQLGGWGGVYAALPVPLKMLLDKELFMLKPGFLFTPNPDILTHKHSPGEKPEVIRDQTDVRDSSETDLNQAVV